MFSGRNGTIPSDWLLLRFSFLLRERESDIELFVQHQRSVESLAVLALEASLQRAKDAGQLVVKSVERKETAQEPPLLYDLTTLQKEANTKLNFSADKTLSIAQSLYEKKVMSYPRTGSRYISEDVFEEMPERIALLERYPRFAGYAAGLNGTTLNRRSVNDGKVTDHHALIVTENLPGELSKDERAVYELVAGRMLEAFSGKCVKDVTTALLSAGDTGFTVKGAVMKTAGWRAVFSEQDTEDEDAATLPPLQEGQTLPFSGVDLLEKQTKPKPLHTESSLLAAMENAGKELEDAELKASLKDAGIGTPATRAAIIETLFARQYIVREKKNLVPTDKGLAVYRIVKDKKIADVEMTGMWETALAKIEAGSMDADTFRKGIEVYAAQITAELLSVQLSFASGETCPCPKCGSGRILFYPKVAKCSNVDCTLTIFRSKCDKQLTDKQIVELVMKRKTGLIKGYGFGLLFPSGSRLGGETNFPAGGTGFELPKLGRNEILVLQITVAYHHKRRCLHPAQREHALPGGYAQRLGGVYPYQPVGFTAGLGGKIEVIVTFARLQVFHALPDCPVGQAAYPQPDKGLVAA